MKNVDVEIYLNQLIGFFDKNPNDLIDLIGDLLKETFYEKVREQCIKNSEQGGEVSLTQKQIINIVIDITITVLCSIFILILMLQFY